ncbi:hypothetical protein Ptr902_03777 [Pyrenophora tritici-repentis]|nr:hypothetical protein Ptr902_03777 [Pyrenophora tritici-repentis]
MKLNMKDADKLCSVMHRTTMHPYQTFIDTDDLDEPLFNFHNTRYRASWVCLSEKKPSWFLNTVLQAKAANSTATAAGHFRDTIDGLKDMVGNQGVGSLCVALEI